MLLGLSSLRNSYFGFAILGSLGQYLLCPIIYFKGVWLMA
uniref:Uncharacterized protein n=1 Tax=Rhizophora mucronata TaxID=61149 RepID=A0A2P2P126_RHIMU